MPKFSKPLILLALAAAITAAIGVGARPAEARTMSICSRALIHDWYVDGRVDKTYPVHCYRDALKQIPEDQIIYGTLRDDLNRALQATIRQHGGHVDDDTLVVPLAGPSDGGSGSGTGATGGGVFHWLAKKLAQHGRLDSDSAARPRRPRLHADGGRRSELRGPRVRAPSGGGRSAARGPSF
jgi:hypothetical protein